MQFKPSAAIAKRGGGGGGGGGCTWQRRALSLGRSKLKGFRKQNGIVVCLS